MIQIRAPAAVLRKMAAQSEIASMIDISSKPSLVEHYTKLADELDDTADRIRQRPGIDYDLALKLRNIADEIRQNLGILPSDLRPAGIRN